MIMAAFDYVNHLIMAASDYGYALGTIDVTV